MHVSKVLDEGSAQSNGMLGGTPLSFLIGDESGFSKKRLSSTSVERQHNGRLGKVDNWFAARTPADVYLPAIGC